MGRKLLGLALFLAFHTAQAAGLKVWPIKVTLSPERMTESITVTSTSEETMNLQVSALSWDMDEAGNFIEADTGDFVFFPRLITLPPGEEKSVRVGYQGDFPELEKPYRLIVQELPPVLEPEQQEEGAEVGVQYVLRISLPVFVMPGEEPPRPEVAVDEVKLTKNGFAVGIAAPGTHHIEVKKVEASLLGDNGNTLAEGEAEPRLLRVLPHRRVFTEVPMSTDACGGAREMLLEVHVDRMPEPYAQRVPISAEHCAGGT